MKVALNLCAGMVDIAAAFLELPSGMQHFMTSAAFGVQVTNYGSIKMPGSVLITAIKHKAKGAVFL